MNENYNMVFVCSYSFWWHFIIQAHHQICCLPLDVKDDVTIWRVDIDHYIQDKCVLELVDD